MKYLLSQEDHAADLLVMPVWEGPSLACESKRFGSLVSSALKQGDFRGKNGETLLLYPEEGNVKRVLLVGLGKKEAVSVEEIRRFSASVVKVAQSAKAQSLSLHFFTAPKLSKEAVEQGLWEGMLLAHYAFDHFKTDAKKQHSPRIATVGFIGLDRLSNGLLDRLQVIAEGVHFARDLVNGNADDVTPRYLADTALQLMKTIPSITATVHDRAWLEKQKMGLILAVNRASSVDPYLIELSYKGNPSSSEHIVLVGKGVTYDTGGLALKTLDGMLAMKCDMAGAAAVLGAIRNAALLQLKVNVTVIVPTVENCIGPLSYKLGDVYSSYLGKTVEINNTDAEGRLILADAVAYASRHLKPTAMVDLATLTGNVVLALGEHIAGFCSNDDPLSKQLEGASKETGELLWRLPLHAEYKKAFKSDIADLTNSGGREAGCIKGALFIEEFIGQFPWAHLDIAGAAYWSKPEWYNPTKATGYGVRLLTEFLSRL